MVSTAHAEKADRDKPTNIVFSQAAIDDLKQTQIFTGDVIYTRGTIIIRSDQLAVRQDPENYSYGSATMTQPDKLAYYKQKREGIDEDVEGQSSRIDYNEKTDLVTLTGNAVMRRLTGTKLMDEVHGNVIQYHSLTESYTVVGNAPSDENGNSNPTSIANPTAGNGARARVTMQPKNRTANDTPSAGSSPGGPVATPLELKTLPTLNSKPAP